MHATVSPVALWVRAIRAPSLTATLMPAVATALLGHVQGWVMAPLTALFAGLGVLLVQIGVNLLNDIEDDNRGIDRPGRLGGSGVLQDGSLAPRTLTHVAWAAFALGALCGLPALLREPALLGVVAVAALGAWGYSSGPGLKYRALGDLAVVLLCGPVLTVGFALAAFGQASWLVVTMGLAFGLAAVGILHVNNLQDMAIDAAAGARTIALRLGAAASRGYLVVVYALAAIVWPIAAALAGLPWPAAVVPLVAIAPIAALVTRVVRASREGGLDQPAFALVRIDAAKVHLALGALVSVGLVIAHIY